ncbi:SAM-dependent methyltransferase [Nanoarchaeota archaeon]
MKTRNIEWWMNEGDFFGELYVSGDNSSEGYLQNCKENLDQRTEREATGVARLLQIPSGSHILDVPTGYGRHAFALAEHGFQVTGIDINDYHLDIARKHGAHESVEYIKGDMRSLDPGFNGRYDAVINMFFSFGFFRNEDENIEVMRQFYNALKPDGKLLLHTKAVHARIRDAGRYHNTEVRNLSEGRRLAIEERYNPMTRRIEGSWSVIEREGGVKSAAYDVRLYSEKEYKEIASECGFREIRFHGSFEGDVFDGESKELIMVAEKPI